MASIDVVSAFGGVAAYVEAVRDAPADERRALYRRLVLDPVWERCLTGSALEDRAPWMLDASAAEPAPLAEAAAAVARSDVRRVVEDAYARSAALLTGPDTTVGLFPADPANAFVVERMRGVLGWAAGAGKIALLLAPAGDWLAWVPYTVAHEHHHSAWRWRHPGHGDHSLLEHLVFEGRADSFARLVEPGVVAPWTVALDPAEERDRWRAMQPHLHSHDRDVTWPLLADGGYAIGFRIVQAYLRTHPESSIEAWTALDPARLLRESGYDEGDVSAPATE